jgi:hypothetical protein
MAALDTTSTGNSGATHIADHDALHTWYNAATSNGDDLNGWGDWVAFTGSYNGTWADYGDAAWHNAAYRKHSDGRVELRGLVKNGVFGTSIFSLPTGYRPALHITLVTISDGEVLGRVTIESGGDIIHISGATTWYSLNNISFDSTGGS